VPADVVGEVEGGRRPVEDAGREGKVRGLKYDWKGEGVSKLQKKRLWYMFLEQGEKGGKVETVEDSIRLKKKERPRREEPVRTS